MIIHSHFDINEKGHLTIGGADAVEIAKKFGTPAYVIDENAIRARCREYLSAVKREFGEESNVLYASKALCFTGI
jgi:diaminopimelate decarboxylase